jgi:hypothetical protein
LPSDFISSDRSSFPSQKRSLFDEYRFCGEDHHDIYRLYFLWVNETHRMQALNSWQNWKIFANLVLLNNPKE